MQLKECLKKHGFFRATDRSTILCKLFPFMWKALISQNSNAWVPLSSGHGLKTAHLGHRKPTKPEVVLNSWSASIHVPACTETVFCSACCLQKLFKTVVIFLLPKEYLHPLPNCDSQWLMKRQWKKPKFWSIICPSRLLDLARNQLNHYSRGSYPIFQYFCNSSRSVLWLWGNGEDKDTE